MILQNLKHLGQTNNFFYTGIKNSKIDHELIG